MVYMYRNTTQQVPLLVVSAGITDVVAETLRLHGLLLDNVTVRANTMLFGEDERLERFRESPPVHSRREYSVDPPARAVIDFVASKSMKRRAASGWRGQTHSSCVFRTPSRKKDQRSRGAVVGSSPPPSPLPT